MVTLARRVNRTPMAPVIGVMFGMAAAILVAAMPSWIFDRVVVQSGLPTILPFAAPPLGLTARLLAIAFAAIVVGGGLWLVIAIIEKLLTAKTGQRALWYDAGYSAAEQPVTIEGRRRPIFAPAELGAPLMSDEAIAAMRPYNDAVAEEPADADRATPIKSWIHPAIEAESVSSWQTSPTSLPELNPDPELEVPLSAAEFDLPPSDTPGEDDNSLQSLIRRLESGLARRSANDPGPHAPAPAPRPLTLSKEWIVSDNAPLHSDTHEGDGMRQALGTLHKFASR